jgi:hypothetical protein
LTDQNFATVAGSETLTNKTLTSAALTAPVITGTASIWQMMENVTVSATAATGTVNYDVLTNGAVTYYTANATGNWTLNLRGDGSTTMNSVMSTGKSLNCSIPCNKWWYSVLSDSTSGRRNNIWSNTRVAKRYSTCCWKYKQY